MIFHGVKLRNGPGADTDQFIYEAATLALCWSRSCPDFIDDEQISIWLRQWWAENKDDLPGRMDRELIDSLWFDHGDRK
jgi:hypothetical protein